MLEKIIQTRRSVFPAQYTGGLLPKKDLLKILESARWAPNHRKTEPWRYKVISGTALSRLGDFMATAYSKIDGHKNFKLKKLQENPSKSSAVILIFMHRDEKESVPEWEEIAAVSMSVHNMWLTTHDMGYGCYWSSPKPFATMSNFKGITVEKNERFLGFLYIGTYQKEAQELPDRKSLSTIVEFVDK